MLNEDRRQQLDGIVQKMVANKEPDENVRFVVDDFKKKYEHEVPAPAIPARPTGSRSLLPNLNQGAAIVDDIRAIGKDALQTGRNIGERAIGAQRQSPASTILQGVGLGAKVAGEAVFGVPAKIIGRMIPDAERAPLKAALGKGLSAATKTAPVQKALSGAQRFADNHPEAAANLGAAGNIAATFLGAGATKEAATIAQSGLKSGSKAVAKATLRSAEKTTAKELGKTLELTRPVLAKTEKEAALAAGRGKTGGIFKPDVIAPTSRDIERATIAHDFIAKAKDENHAIKLINDAIATKSDVIKTGLKQSGDPIFNKSQLRSFITKFQRSPERQIILAGDTAANKAYNGILDTFMVVLDKHPKTVSGLLAARKEFDQIAEAGMKNVFGDGVSSARKQAILDIRRLANRYIEEQIPVGEAMKAVLHQQNLLFEAGENIAARKAASVGTNRISQFAKKHPTLIRVGSTAAGGGAFVAGGKSLLGL